MHKQKPNIDQYLRQVQWPEVDNQDHRQGLRRQVLATIERKQVMSSQNRIFKLFLIVLTIIGGGAIATAVGVKVYRYHFDGQSKDGTFVFSKEREIVYQDEEKGISVSRGGTVSMGYYPPEGKTDATEMEKVEQAQNDLDEIEQLREANNRELLSVIDTWVNGNFHRIYRTRYTLSDGRTITMGEGAPEMKKQRTPEQIKLDHEEIANLREQGQRELVGIIETEVEGRIHRVCQFSYVLSDGRTLSVGEGDPLDPSVNAPVLSMNQLQEVFRLKRLDQGESLGILEREVHGHIFACDTYLLTLEDGTVVTHATGNRKGYKQYLTDADREEYRELAEQNAGEFLDVTEKEIDGILFRFERHRYNLSGGTEYIQAIGDPVE